MAITRKYYGKFRLYVRLWALLIQPLTDLKLKVDIFKTTLKEHNRINLMRMRYTGESLSALLEKTASLFSIFTGPGTIIWLPLFTVFVAIWKSCTDFCIIFKLLQSLWTKNATIYIVQLYHILILNLTLWELLGFSVACIIMQSSLCNHFFSLLLDFSHDSRN